MADNPFFCFTQLLGQEKAKRLLRRSLAAERIPHAYIFKGPEGVGKKFVCQGRGGCSKLSRREQDWGLRTMFFL